MKTSMKTSVVLIFAAFFCHAGESVEVLRIENGNGFENIGYWGANQGLNSKKPGGVAKIVAGGRSGKCMQVKNTPSSEFNFYSKAEIPVKRGEDTLKLSLYNQGKGSFSVFLYVYEPKNGKSAYLTTVTVKKDLKVDSLEWVKTEVVYPVTLKMFIEGAKVRLAFVVSPGSDLKFDDLEWIMERTPAKK